MEQLSSSKTSSMEQQQGSSSFGAVMLTPAISAAVLGGVITVLVSNYRRRKDNNLDTKGQHRRPSKIVPVIERKESGRIATLERFSHYVARQLGFDDPNECPQLCKLANDYLKKSEGCENNMYDYVAQHPEADSLYLKLMEELDRCILSYFAFHWNQSSLMISQVLDATFDHQKSKLKDLVMAATRKQRFDRVMRNLKVTRVFSTLVEEMRAIGSVASDGESKCTNVMVPVAHSERSPVLLLMGGGMGAGKSTVLKDILKESFWAGAASNAVVVEADAFKETDVVYKALNSTGHHNDMIQTSELVHQSSTDAASSLLVTALNDGRDVIMDGTLAWIPFVEQTIAMARNVHKRRYRMGIGYKVAEDGTVTENYWEQVEGEEGDQQVNMKPYRIELAGVVCDAYLAVIRGIRRAIIMGRAVRVNSQLKSHKRFASAFPGYCKLVDNARVYCTNAMGGPPMLIGWKDGNNRLLIDPEEYKWLNILANLNDSAESVEELYTQSGIEDASGLIWKDIVLSSSRASLQVELKNTLQKIESGEQLENGHNKQRPN